MCWAGLASIGLRLADIGSSTSITQLLLGSMPRTAAAALGDNSQIHRDILRASARFIEDGVYLTGWTYGHKFRRGD